MAKKVYKIDAFEGGINQKADPRDIGDNELEEAFNASISNKGRITITGDALYLWYTTNDYAKKEYNDSSYGTYYVQEKLMINGSDRFILDNNTNLTNGYGLFSCAHDYTSNGMHSSDTGNFSSPQPQESEFVLLNDGAHIDLWDSCWNNNGAKGKTRWVENAITLGHVHSTDEDGEGIAFKDKVKPTYYKAESGIRVCDGNFSESQLLYTLETDLTLNDDTLDLTASIFVDSDIGTYLKLESEIVKINSIHGSDYSVVYVKRGCFGTIPKLHTAGTDVYRLNVPKILKHVKRPMLEHATCYDTNDTDITYTNTEINTWKDDIQSLERPERTHKMSSGAFGKGLIVYNGKVTGMGRFVDTGTPTEEPGTNEKVLLSIHESNSADENEVTGVSYDAGGGLNGEATIELTATSTTDFPSLGFVPGKTIIISDASDSGVNGLHDIVGAGATDNIIEVTGALTGTDADPANDPGNYIIRLEEDRIDENIQNKYVFGMSYLYEGGGGEMQESPIQMGYVHTPLIPHNDSIIRNTASAADQTGWQRQDTEGGSYEDINDTDSKWVHDSNSLLWNSHDSGTFEFIAYKGASDLTAGGSYKLAIDVTISGATSSTDVLHIHPPTSDADSNGGTVGGVAIAKIGQSGTYFFDCVADDDDPGGDLDKWFLAEAHDQTAVIRINSGQMFEANPVEMSASNAIDMRSFEGVPKMFSSFNMNTHADYTWNERISGYKIYMKQVDSATSQLSSDWNLLLKTDFSTGKFTNEVEKVLNLSNDWSAAGSSKMNSLVATSINLAAGGYSVRGISDYDALRHIPLQTYESENGYKADVTTCAMYKTSTMINRKMFIGNLKIGERTYPDRMIEAPADRFDTFPDDGLHKIDVAVGDGDEIIKLEAVGNKLVQFKEHNAYLLDVDSEGIDLIDTWPKMGIQNPCQVVQAGKGLVWVNDNGLFYYNGEEVQDITNDKFNASTWKIKEDDALPASLAYDKLSNKVIIQTSNRYAHDNGGYVYDMSTGSIMEVQDVFTWWEGGIPGNLISPDLDIDLYGGNSSMFRTPVGKVDSSTGVPPTTTVQGSDGRVAVSDTFRTNIITTRNQKILMATNTIGSPTKVEFNTWRDEPKYLFLFSGSASQFNVQTKDIDFGNPSRRKKVYRVYVTFKAGGYMSGVIMKYATNGSNTFDGTFVTTTGYDSAKGFDSFQGSTSNSTTDWITVGLKPSSAINNVYSLQLKFEYANAGHTGYTLAGTSAFSTNYVVLTSSGDIANDNDDYYNGMPFFIYKGPGEMWDYRVIDYDGDGNEAWGGSTAHAAKLDLVPEDKGSLLLDNGGYPTGGSSYYDIGHIPRQFEINDISIVYREKPIK